MASRGDAMHLRNGEPDRQIWNVRSVRPSRERLRTSVVGTRLVPGWFGVLLNLRPHELPAGRSDGDTKGDLRTWHPEAP
jgi:hypothetical protein